MRNLENYNVRVMDNKELQNINGGFLVTLTVLAAIAGVVYIVGEIAYIAGRQDSGCDK